MRSIILLLALLITSFFSLPAFAANYFPPCTPEALDAVMLPWMESSAAKGEELVIEVSNRSQATCRLPWMPRLELAPSKGPVPPWMGDGSGQGNASPAQDVDLDPGGVAHLIIAWSLIPEPLPRLSWDDCRLFDSLKLSLQEKQPVLQVPHLWIRGCGQVYISRFRPGHFAAGESPAEDWIRRFGLKASDFARPTYAADPGEASPSVRTLFKVVVQRADAQNGPWLIVRVPAPADAQCPIDMVRKREQDGNTTIHLAHCESQGQDSAGGSRRGEKELWIVTDEDNGLSTRRPGEVEYDAVSRVLEKGKPRLARSDPWRIQVRNPVSPTVPVIDASLPSCQTEQLQITSLPPIYSDRETQPKTYAKRGSEKYQLNIIEVANTSAQPCELGGIPELVFHAENEQPGQRYRPAVCDNCETPQYRPRSSGWIDVPPGGSAHFLIGATIFDQDHGWNWCVPTASIDLALPKAHLLFTGAICSQVSVSAWRAGRYDGDPLNANYTDPLATSAEGPLPENCAKKDFSKFGRPFFAPGRHVGFSSPKREYRIGERVPVHLWVDNDTDREMTFLTCPAPSIGTFDLFDSYGHRLLSKREQKARELKSKDPFLSRIVCTRTALIRVPPHSCKAGPELDYTFSLELNEEYSLAPGQYFVKKAPGSDRESSQTSSQVGNKVSFTPGQDLVISVEE